MNPTPAPSSLSTRRPSTKRTPRTSESPGGSKSTTTSVTFDRSARVLRFGDVHEDADVVLARTTLRPGVEVDESAAASMNALRARVDARALAKIRDYDPGLPAGNVDAIRSFISDSLTLALPLTAYSVETLLGPVTYFVHWAVFVVGCDLDAQVIFDRELVETYVREVLPPDLAPGTRRNYRAWITRVAEVVNPNKNPRAPMPLNEKSMQSPYTDDEVVALDRWAAGQPTPYRRQGAAMLVALGAGAGLSSIEIVQVTRDAVTLRDNGIVEIKVVGKGKPDRRVIVSAQFEAVVADQLEGLTGDAFVFLPKRGRSENDVVSAFVGRTTRPPGTPHITVRKLRNTWFVTQMVNRVDVLTLMEAAGLQSLESISRLAKFVPRPSGDDRDAQLRGAL